MPVDKHMIKRGVSLGNLQPNVKTKVELWLNHCQAEGLLLFVDGTFRERAEQERLWALGRRRIAGLWVIVNPKAVVTYAKPGDSYHEYGLAVDVYVLDKFGQPDFTRHVPDRVVALARMCGLVWGGDWKGRKQDPPHFQDRDAPKLAECKFRWPSGWRPAFR